MTLCECGSMSLATDQPTAINLIYCNLPELFVGGGMRHSTSLIDWLIVTLFHSEKLGITDQSADSRLGEVVGSLEPTVCTYIVLFSDWLLHCFSVIYPCKLSIFGCSTAGQTKQDILGHHHGLQGGHFCISDTLQTSRTNPLIKKIFSRLIDNDNIC